MSTIGEVRAAEKRVKEIMEKLRKASPKDDSVVLCKELRRTTDEYTKAVLELKLP
jgi:16S rRNA C1402 (ribose-2'-O) methylase RsmI